MNLINLVKITPFLISNLVSVNKTTKIEPYNLYSFRNQIETEGTREYFVSRPSQEQKTWPIDLQYIEYETYGNDFKQQLLSHNYQEGIKFDIATTNDILYITFRFTENIDINNVNITSNNINIDITKSQENNECWFTLNMAELEPNTRINYNVLVNNYTPPETPEPPEDPYKDYTNFDINQSRLQVIRTNKNSFSSYSDITRFNTININSAEITINFQKEQYAKLNYTDKNITIPILGTFINNNTQYNIVDFYFTDNDSNVINLLNCISSPDMYYASPTRTQTQFVYTYKNSSFNYFNYQAEIPYKLDYNRTSNSTIQITTNDVGTGNNSNASIINNENNLDSAFITSMFGIDPLTISYFGMPNVNKVAQRKKGGSVSGQIYQNVELANYNKYLPIYTYNPNIEQSKGELYIPLSNLSNNFNINVIAFRNDVNDDIHININDITTLFGVLDNLENLGLEPFTFGTIIFIGLTLGFIMVLIKILK